MFETLTSPDNPPRPEQPRELRREGLCPSGQGTKQNILSPLLLQDTQRQVELCGQELCPGQKMGQKGGLVVAEGAFLGVGKGEPGEGVRGWC